MSLIILMYFKLELIMLLLHLKLLKKICQYTVGIDINMGCPKHFSVSGGMGSALLNQPETVKDILSTLIRNLNNPITCKIRIKNTIQETIDFMKMVESTGVRAIAVHMRKTPERPKDPAHWDSLQEIIQLGNFSIPIIANGDVFKHDDIVKVKQQTGCSSVMIARGACINPSIFQSEQHPIQDVLKEYLKIAIDTNNNFGNTKYTVLYLCKTCGKWLGNTEEGRKIHQSKHFRVITECFGLSEYYDQFQANLKEKNNILFPNINNNDTNNPEQKDDENFDQKDTECPPGDQNQCQPNPNEDDHPLKKRKTSRPTE